MKIQKINMRIGNQKEEFSELVQRIDKFRIPNHIAIIMDGNGRWGMKHGLSRSLGHQKGVAVLKNIIKTAKKWGVKVLTVYAFSTENWSRPKEEITFLFNLFEKVLLKEISEIDKESIKVNFIGDLTILPEKLKKVINQSQKITKNNKEFHLNVCTNYGGRQELVRAAKRLAFKSISGEIKPEEIDEKLFESELLTTGSDHPDLLIRTSGERRISNFLLWQLAYSEIYITNVFWPEFDEGEFLKAIIDYQSRNRRFGGIESLPNESFEDSSYPI